jgi:hypothetical protein
MNAPQTSTASSSTVSAAAAQAALPPWKKEAIFAEAWVPVMADGSPCLCNCVTGKITGFATKAEAEKAAYNCTSYGAPNAAKLLKLKVAVESYVKTPGFAGYYMP